MSDYTKITDFGAKDSLISGDPLKVVKGSEIDDEFDAIATAVASKYDTTTANTALDAKADLAGDTFTGPVVLPAGTAAAPSLTFASDTNTGIYSSGADTIGFTTGGTERARFNTSGLAIGDYLAASSPLEAWKNSDGIIARFARGNGTNNPRLEISATDATKTLTLDATGSTTPNLEVKIGGTSYARFDISGRFYSYVSYATPGVVARSNIRYSGGGTEYGLLLTPVTDNTQAIHFTNAAGTGIGNIAITTTGTAYNTTSDYRLKTDATPLVGALARVSKLRPCSYRWKSDGSIGEGFIAHEVQEVIPLAVTGEKDGAEMQSVDYGRLTPLLAAAIQELVAENKEKQKQIEALEARLTALEAK